MHMRHHTRPRQLAGTLSLIWLAGLAWQVGMSEHDAFLYALEISLDSLGKRDVSHEWSALSSACGPNAPGVPRDATPAQHGHGVCSNESDDGEWETVAKARPRDTWGSAAGRKGPLSHPHLGSACKERAGVQYELDEYGRVSHFGSLPPSQVSSAASPATARSSPEPQPPSRTPLSLHLPSPCATCWVLLALPFRPQQPPPRPSHTRVSIHQGSPQQPRAVVPDSRHDPLRGVAVRAYRKGDAAAEAEEALREE